MGAVVPMTSPNDVAPPAAGSRPLPRLILPPGWSLLPVARDNAATAERALAPLRAAGPRDSVTPLVRQLERSLSGTLDEAFATGAFAVALPLGVPWEVPVSTSIALSTLVPASGAATLPTVGESVETDAGAARRRIVDIAADAVGGDEPVLLRTIDYTWVHEGAYLLAFASISGLTDPEYAPVTEALTLLITTMLDALAWPVPTPGDSAPPLEEGDA